MLGNDFEDCRPQRRATDRLFSANGKAWHSGIDKELSTLLTQIEKVLAVEAEIARLQHLNH